MHDSNSHQFPESIQFLSLESVRHMMNNDVCAHTLSISSNNSLSGLSPENSPANPQEAEIPPVMQFNS